MSDTISWVDLDDAARSLVEAGPALPADLDDVTAEVDPIRLFASWYLAAVAAELPLPEATALATADHDGAPSVRMVLLKGLGREGWTVFTNHESRKGRQLATNPQAALCFHWASLERQVRVEGAVEAVSREASEAYFATRPRGSRIGAWASEQSRSLADRAILKERVEELDREFDGGTVPLPPFWGGFLVRPRRIEFWQGRPSRLHDRRVFVGGPGAWSSELLWP